MKHTMSVYEVLLTKNGHYDVIPKNFHSSSHDKEQVVNFVPLVDNVVPRGEVGGG